MMSNVTKQGELLRLEIIQDGGKDQGKEIVNGKGDAICLLLLLELAGSKQILMDLANNFWNPLGLTGL